MCLILNNVSNLLTTGHIKRRDKIFHSSAYAAVAVRWCEFGNEIIMLPIRDSEDVELVHVIVSLLVLSCQTSSKVHILCKQACQTRCVLDGFLCWVRALSLILAIWSLMSDSCSFFMTRTAKGTTLDYSRTKVSFIVNFLTSLL